MAVKKFLDLSGVSTLLDQLKNIFVKTDDTTNTISSTDGSKIPTSQAVIDYVEENGGGGGGTSVAIAKDIPVTLLSTGWTGDSAPYSQQVTALDVREGMTPLIFLQGQATDEQIYAYNLITDYQAGNGTITFYAAEVPEINIPIVLKGVPAQEISFKDNTILVPVVASNFTLSETTQRYEQTITVEGMTVGLGGTWDILRSGEVLSEEESKIASNITDVIRQTDAIKIVCLEVPEQDYTLVLSGTFKDVAEGDVLISGLDDLINSAGSEIISDKYSSENSYMTGDYCIYNNNLYKANQTINKEEFNVEHWTQTTISEELDTLNSNYNNIQGKLSAPWSLVANTNATSNTTDWSCTIKITASNSYSNMLKVSLIIEGNSLGTSASSATFTINRNLISSVYSYFSNNNYIPSVMTMICTTYYSDHSSVSTAGQCRFSTIGNNLTINASGLPTSGPVDDNDFSINCVGSILIVKD